jgi:hypothetical protein
MNWNLLQYYILSSRLYFKYLLVVSLILISALICYLLVAPNKQTVSSTFFLEQKTSSNPLLPFQQNSGENGKLFETQKHILKSKRLFSDLKEDYLLDVERMYINKDQRLERLLGISFGSDTKQVEKLDDRTLQKMFLSQVSMSFNSNASTIEISYVCN